MNGVMDGAQAEARCDYDWVNKDVAAEVLKQAQAMVAAQHSGIGAVDAKLTTVLSQGVALGLAAFGAAALPFAERARLPGWAGVGLVGAGSCVVSAAFAARCGLGLRDWAAPGLSPSCTAFPSVLKADAKTAMMFMAWACQDGADANRATAARLGRSLRVPPLRAPRALLAAAPLVGAAVAICAWWRLGFPLSPTVRV